MELLHKIRAASDSLVSSRNVLKLGWPVGPLMAQAAHAATAVLIENRNHENVKSYEEDIENMRKVRVSRQ